MRITLDVLRRFTDVPADAAQARVLLDEVGLEVKRIDASAPGVPITLELLANRGDHHGYVGLAREVAGRTGGEVRQPHVLGLTVGEAPHPIRVDTELCPVYQLTLLERTGAGTLPAEALELLESCGLNPVGAVVDATNVANLELGQPTHAFDADKVQGAVVVRTSAAGERAWPLFTAEPVPLPEGTLVIADDVKILAIAGVIGCEDSKTTDATTRVLLESAGFDPVAVRKASRALELHTDASARFERGSDFSLPIVGAGRVAALLASAGWTVVGSTGQAGAWTDPRVTVPFDPGFCRSFLDVDLDDDALAERLGRYGFGIERGASGAWTVLVPPHRVWDVEFPADLYEEIAKSLGYDNTPIGLPPVDMGALPTHAEVVRDTIADVLVGAGLYEVITDGFHGRALHDALGLPEGHVLQRHVETENALDRGYSLLKNNALAQAVEGVALNARMKHDAVRAFEFTRTFHPDAQADNGVCTERSLVWAIASGPERSGTWADSPRAADAWFLKGLVAEIGTALQLPLEVRPGSSDHPLSEALHPGRQASVWLDNALVGILGEVHPRVVAAHKIKRARPVYLELDLEPLQAPARPTPFTEPPRVPPVVRNLAFTLPEGVHAAEVAAAMADAGPEWLVGIDVVDRYDHDEDGVPVHTYTYALSYGNEDANRTADQLNGATEALITAVETALGARGVRLRKLRLPQR